VVRDQAIARLIGEILEATGPDGAVIVESGEAVETTFEYLEGVRWDSGLVSPDVFLSSGQASLRMIEPCLLITDAVLDEPERMLPVLEAAVALGAPRLFVVAPEVREPVIALLGTNVQRGVLEAAAVVQAPSTGDVRAAILGDLAIISGGRLVRTAAGGLAEFLPADLGRARQVWATRTAFGILGGRGTRGAIRQRVAEARADLQRAADDHYQRTMAQQRIGRLLGIGAVIRVGAASELAREDLRLRAEAAVSAARLALEDGVVAGGGLALVRAAAALRCRTWQADEAVAVQVLAQALEAPLRSILRNAGQRAPGRVLDEASRRGAWETYDVLRGAWVDAWQTGVLDPLSVPRTAVEVGVSAARTALTTGALVRRRQVRPPAGR
jgi:chaperonin GroEL